MRQSFQIIFFLLTTNDQNDHQRQIIAVNDSEEDTVDPGDTGAQWTHHLRTEIDQLVTLSVFCEANPEDKIQ